MKDVVDTHCQKKKVVNIIDLELALNCRCIQSCESKAFFVFFFFSFYETEK